MRALEKMGEKAVIRDDLLQVGDDWAHLQEARKRSALPPPPVPLDYRARSKRPVKDDQRPPGISS